MVTYGIELPVRRIGKDFTKITHANLGILVFILVSGLLQVGSMPWFQNGWPFRVPNRSGSSSLDAGLSMEKCKNNNGFCRPMDKKAKLMIVGDSQSQRMDHFIGVLAKNSDFSVSRNTETLFSCIPVFNNGRYCEKSMNQQLSDVLHGTQHGVVLVAYWFKILQENNWHNDSSQSAIIKLRDDLYMTVKQFSQAGKKAYVVGPVPYYPGGVQHCYTRPLAASCEQLHPINLALQRQTNEVIKEASLSAGGLFFDVFQRLCHQDLCKTGFEGISLYADHIHVDQRYFGAYFIAVAGLKKMEDVFQ